MCGWVLIWAISAASAEPAPFAVGDWVILGPRTCFHFGRGIPVWEVLEVDDRGAILVRSQGRDDVGLVKSRQTCTVARKIEILSDYIRRGASRPDMAHAFRGDAYAGLGDYERAIADYTEAIEGDPKAASYRYRRGLMYSACGRWDEAIADFTEAIRNRPKYGHAYAARGSCYGRKGRYARALADLDEAIRLSPFDPDAREERAHLLATCPEPRYRDGARAVEDATLAFRADKWMDLRRLETLAEATAEACGFGAEIGWRGKIEGDDPVLDLCRTRKLYQKD
jgi:tetratricopeptide (TPR) repeat protein